MPEYMSRVSYLDLEETCIDAQSMHDGHTWCCLVSYLVTVLRLAWKEETSWLAGLGRSHSHGARHLFYLDHKKLAVSYVFLLDLDWKVR